jgi:uncharacterized OsmC-like protein
VSDYTFAPLVRDTRSALSSAPPDAALTTFRVESQQTSGLRSDVRIRQFEVGVDEPPTLGGGDTAPNPVEYALLALATCQEITYRLHADHLGIPLDGVAVTLEGDIDLRGFFAVDEEVRPGFRAIRGIVTLTSSAPESDLDRLKAHVDAHCPVLDLVSHETPLDLERRTLVPA